MQWFRSFLQQGCSEHYSEESNRKITVINLFAFVGISITLLLGVRALLAQQWILAASLLVASSLFYTTRLIQIKIHSERSHQISANLLQYSLMALMLYLVISGGHAGTGPLWIYLVPPVAMFFGGFKRGLRNLAIFTALLMVILLAPIDGLLQANYFTEFKTRLLYSFMTVTFLSAFYEYSRQKTYLAIHNLRDEFQQLALQDPLTHLSNRRGMREQITREIGRSRRQKTPLSVILCDVDHFKSINDQYGHDTGDVVLQHISELFRTTIREQDAVSRWGGEEFLFLLPETDTQHALQLAEKIRIALAESPLEYNGNTIKTTASFGIAEISEQCPLDQALSLADKSLYQAKNDGRNRVCAL